MWVSSPLISHALAACVACVAVYALLFGVDCLAARPPTHRAVRSQHARTARKRAKRIILVRHGESEGNVDNSVYQRVADHRIRLTETGREQARACGVALQRVIGSDPLLCFVSPFARTRDTFAELQSQLTHARVVRVREEPRVREQEFGNFQDSALHRDVDAQRTRYGRFYFRMPLGESGADVYDRVSGFIETLYRAFDDDAFNDDCNVLIVTHGLTLRLFLMRFFHWSVETFEATHNPGNGAFVVMQRLDDGRYKLTAESAAVIGLSPEQCRDPLLHMAVSVRGAGEGAGATSAL